MSATKKFAALFAGAAALAVAAGLGYAAGHKDRGAMSALDEVEWIPRANSPVETAVLAGDPATGPHIRLVKLPAGFVVPDHAHTGDYHGVNLTGTWKHTFLETGESRELPPGSFVFQPSSRAARCTATPASDRKTASSCCRSWSRRISSCRRTTSDGRHARHG